MALPVRNGVGASVIALPPGRWTRVIDFLIERFPHVPPAEIAARMARGDVADAGGAPLGPDHPYRAGDKLYYYRHVENEAPIPFTEDVLFEDELIVVADKPHYLPVTPGGRYVKETLLVRLKQRLGIDTLAPMHRIDRETAGLTLFTKDPATRAAYQAAFANRDVAKSYLAVAVDRDLPTVYRSRLVTSGHFMRMHEVAGEANSETGIAKLEALGGLARYRLAPVTGKRHQLRVHMAALGAPLLNDQIYPVHASIEAIENDDYARPLQLLAEAIAFTDPVSGAQRAFRTRRTLMDLTQCAAMASATVPRQM